MSLYSETTLTLLVATLQSWRVLLLRLMTHLTLMNHLLLLEKLVESKKKPSLEAVGRARGVGDPSNHPYRDKLAITAAPHRIRKPNPALCPKGQKHQARLRLHGRSSREILKIMKRIGWASMPSILKATKSCPSQKLEPRIVSLVVTDLKTRRLIGLKKEGFEDLLRKVGVPCQYFCCRSFATWDVLLPSQEQAAKVTSTNIATKFFRLQPEYLGTRRIRVTVCNVPAFITGEVQTSFLSAYGHVEEINPLRSAAGTANGDYTFRLCLTREGF